MLYHGVHKRYNHEDLKKVHDVLALSHHFIICECSMLNFQAGFLRAAVQYWKDVCLQEGSFTRNFGYITSIIFFQKCYIMICQLVDLVISKANKDIV